MAETLGIFISHADADERFLTKLEGHLSDLNRRGVISIWHRRKVEPGKEHAGEVDRRLESAQVVLLLISPSFLASDDCHAEMTRVLARHEEGRAHVIPIILEPCDWDLAPFGKLQVLPKAGKPVTTWSDRDDAFLDIARGIRAVVEGLVWEPSPSTRLATAPSAPTLLQPAAPGSGLAALVRKLAGLTPADFDLLAASIPGAAVQLSRQGPVATQAAQLVNWAKSTYGPGLDAIRQTINILFEGPAENANQTPPINGTMPQEVYREPSFGLRPINDRGMNIVGFGKDKYEADGTFVIRCTFHYMAEAPLTLLEFRGHYWVDGCPCMNLIPRLSIDGQDIPLLGDLKTLKTPLPMELDRTGILCYGNELKPPLDTMRPAGCDYGELEVSYSILEHSPRRISNETQFFRFAPGGSLEPIPSISPVPRFGDSELISWRRAGLLREDLYQRLMALHPVTRFMCLRSNNESNLSINGLTREDQESVTRLPPHRDRENDAESPASPAEGPSE